MLGALQVNLPYSWDAFENAGEEFNNPYGCRLIKGYVCNTEGKKLAKFCERNIFEILNRKYGAGAKGEYTFINWAGNSVIDCALVMEGLIRYLVEFKIGSELLTVKKKTVMNASRKVYERSVENKRCIWQEKAAEYINKLVRKKLNKYGNL
jgi:hypothetical protein